jgi:flagellar biosynthetic protein FlhB
LFVVALLVPASIGGWSFSTKSLAPNLEKLDPIKGLGRIFGWRGLMELAKALAKFLLIAAVAGALIMYMAPQLLQLGDEPLRRALAHAGGILGLSFVVLSAALIVIAAVDVPFQLWQHAKQLRMTRQEVKDEFKETEGRPEVKGRIRQLQREMAQRRMMEEVPKADVVVTNPTHFAVALKYDRKMNAPKVVAKGVDLVAANIRGIAEQHEITMFEAPPLARALYYSTDLGQEIPAGLYVSVAQVLAYVYQLKTAHGAGETAPAPPADLPVPDEFLARDRTTGASQDEAPGKD